jgi:hypothetical protein
MPGLRLATIADLKPGMKLKAVRFQDVPPPSTVTMAEVEAMPSDPAPPAAATPAAPAEPAAAPEEPAAAPEEPAAAPAELPPTGSVLPLLALLGSGLVGTGLALGRSRR